MFNSEYCCIDYRESLGAVFCKWKKNCIGENYRKPLLYGLDLLKAKECKWWITDAENAFENEEEDNKWLIEEFIPKTINSECKKITFIIKKSNPFILEIENQKNLLSKFFEVEIIDKL